MDGSGRVEGSVSVFERGARSLKLEENNQCLSVGFDRLVEFVATQLLGTVE